ncbi:MAG: hypothetical protein MJZ93_06710 [Paludibacteraceae bacterium]|nr:hypothetical protein [Paludibacteraceae bacterium]
MNRLTHSSGGNSDAGALYDFQQTYSPSGRIGDKFCDFTNFDHLGSSSWTTDENETAYISLDAELNHNCHEVVNVINHDDTGEMIHEYRHCSQFINNLLDLKYNKNYSSWHEEDSYRAQIAFVGFMDFYSSEFLKSSIEQGIFPSFVGNQIQFKIQSLDEIDSFFIKSISKSIYGLSLYDF